MNSKIISTFPITTFQRKLLYWYNKHKRFLPWRIDVNPYRIWISEIMLQQTQVSTVVPYYVRFLKRFPDLQSLAHSSEEEILEYWSGLGYYRRARNLLKTAQSILDAYGEFPETFEILIALPGIGRYTAGAICSIAFNQSQPAVDGNIRRVLTRLYGIRDRVPESYFQNLMRDFIPKGRSSSFTQAMMELGALICTPTQPQCPICPAKAMCVANNAGIQNSIPVKPIKRAPEILEISVLILERGGKMLVASPVKPQIIPGEWGLPCTTVSAKESPETAALHLGRSIFHRKITLINYAHFRHNISHYRIFVHAFYGKFDFETQTNDRNNYLWLSRNRIKKIIVSSLFQKAVKKHEELKDSGVLK
jgi:A/G-specific adenine glycosylase